MDLGRLLTLSAVLLVLGCPSTRSDEARGAPRALTILAVNYPLAYFAERLAPEDVNVVFPPPPNVDPAHWKPPPESIAQFQEADLVLLNGADYARWTRTATLPKSAVVVTAAGCRKSFLPSPSSTHRHGPEGEHSHSGTAFTTWLDLELATCQAGHVRDALVRALPNEVTGIQASFGALARDLRELDESLRLAAKTFEGVTLFASHPVYQYLADAYDLEIQSFHLEPDEALDAEALASIESATKEHRPAVMLWEAEPLAETRRTLEDRAIRVVVFDPAANRPSSGDFLDVMRTNVAALRCGGDANLCP
jgi:zinc transport system substrate-binding protein